jgi:hypothetical protein
MMLLPPPHNFILFDLDFNVKFPLLRLLQFSSDLKSSIVFQAVIAITFFYIYVNVIPSSNFKYWVLQNFKT